MLCVIPGSTAHRVVGLYVQGFFHVDLLTQLSHKQMTGVLNQYGEKQEEKRSIDNQAGTQFAESKLPKSG